MENYRIIKKIPGTNFEYGYLQSDEEKFNEKINFTTNFIKKLDLSEESKDELFVALYGQCIDYRINKSLNEDIINRIEKMYKEKISFN